MAAIFIDAFAKSDPLGKLILSVLVVLSLWSWGVLITEYLTLRRAGEASRNFLRRFAAAKSNPTELHGTAALEGMRPSPLVDVYSAGCRRLEGLLRESREEGRRRLGTKEVLDVEDALTMTISSASLGMEMRLGALATIASVSPLLGLFGTVWGIMVAFHQMGVTGSTSIRAVAPGLTIALVTTVAGLAVAIPALVGHNILAGQVRLSVSRMRAFALDFLGLLEQRPTLDPSSADEARA